MIFFFKFGTASTTNTEQFLAEAENASVGIFTHIHVSCTVPRTALPPFERASQQCRQGSDAQLQTFAKFSDDSAKAYFAQSMLRTLRALVFLARASPSAIYNFTLLHYRCGRRARSFCSRALRPPRSQAKYPAVCTAALRSSPNNRCGRRARSFYRSRAQSFSS